MQYIKRDQIVEIKVFGFDSIDNRETTEGLLSSK